MKKLIIGVFISLLFLSCNHRCQEDIEFKQFYYNMLDTISTYGKQFDTDSFIVFTHEGFRSFSNNVDYLSSLTNHEFRYIIVENPIYENQTLLESDIRDLKRWYEENKCEITKAKADSIVNKK